LSLPGEAPVPLPAHASLAPGEAVRLAVRTEDFVVVRGEAPAISGTVLVRSYLGQRTRLRLRRATGEEFDVDLPSAPGLPNEGDVAHLGFLPGRTRLFSGNDGRRLL
jgi:ABC-type Fe3+/spermidine/putrescine transport system ATPase subunit